MLSDSTFIDPLAILRAAPGNYLILLPNPPQFTIADVTDAYLKATYTERESIVGKGLFEVFPDNPDLPDATGVKNLRASLEHVLRYKETHVMERQRYDVLNPSMGRFTFKIWSPLNKPVLNNGDVQYIIHCVEDITEKAELELSRRAAVDTLQQKTIETNSQKLIIESILEASFNGIYALRALRNSNRDITDFQYLFVNKNTANMLGINAADAIGKSILELIPENKDNGFFDLFCYVLMNSKAVRDEINFVSERLKGWFDFSIVPVDEEILVVTINDITEQKKILHQTQNQKNLLDNILRHSPSGITVTEFIRNENGAIIDGRTIMANAITDKILGIPQELILSKKISEIDTHILKSSLFRKSLETLETGIPFISQYYLEAKKRWIEVSVAKMDNDHLINVFTDVTDFKEAQLQLEKSLGELKRTNQNLQEFAYAASHDLKEPARKILYFSDRLENKLTDKINSDDIKLFKKMQKAALRMTTLIDDLLTYSSLNKTIINAELIDLNEKLKNVLEDLELEIQEKQAHIYSDNLPVIMGHRRQLGQLFQNIIGNALKYSSPGVSPEIRIHCKKVTIEKSGSDALSNEELKKEYYLIEIHDNGIGFDQQDADRIFNVFTRLHGNAEYLGTGVGLSIARKVAENHGGFIKAESTINEGATFKIYFPAE